MTNAEKFKSAEDRAIAFNKYCFSQGNGCHRCKLNKCAGNVCRYAWLDLEYKEELKPCPFCGGKARLTSCIHEGCEHHYVECTQCYCSTTGKIFPDKAITIWNGRVK